MPLGFLNMFQVAKDAKVKCFPYAVTKYVNEIFAGEYAKTYVFKMIGLRYFNLFGQSEVPYGAYVAVISK